MIRKLIRRIVAALCLGGAVGALPAADSIAQVLAAGRFPEALQAVDALLKTQPLDPRLWAARGLALRGMGRQKESLDSFERALQMDRTFVPALKAAAELAYQSRDGRAAGYLHRVLELEPGNETAHAMAGVLAYEKSDCARAVDHFTKAGRELEANGAAVTRYGHCLLNLGQPERAAEMFQQLVDRQADSPTARYNLAVAAMEASRWRQAIAALAPLTVGDSPDPDALNLLSAAQAGAGDIDGAVAALRKAAQLAPKDERHYLDLAALCLKHDAVALGIEIVEVGLTHIPASARLSAMRGILRVQLGQNEDAASDFEQASRLEPDQAYGSVGLSVLLAQESQFQESSVLLREKLRQSPNDATLNYLLADGLLREGPEPHAKEFSEAREALLRAVRAKPDFARARALLGKVYLKAGDSSRAVEELQLALQQEPGNRRALNQLVVALQRLGRTEEARAVATRLREQVQAELASDVSQYRVTLIKVPEPAR